MGSPEAGAPGRHVAEVPDQLFDDPEAEARWRARFTAARISLPGWARDAPDRNVYASNASGTWEIYAWDRANDVHRRVTDRPNGTRCCALPPDGESVWWFDDADGDEFGAWVAEPFAGLPEAAAPAPEGAAPAPAVAGVPRGYSAGLAIGRALVAVGAATDAGTTVWLARGSGAAEVVYSHREDAWVAALSRDDALLAIGHSEHGDSRHPAVRVLATADGSAVAEKWDGPGKGLEVLDFSRVEGDSRLLLVHERRGREELLLWDPVADTETELDLALPGELSGSFYPDATALLVEQTHLARSTLHRYDLVTGELVELETPTGTVDSAGVRPDGSIEYTWSSAAAPFALRTRHPDGTDRELLAPRGEPAPGSMRLSDIWITRPYGQVHVLAARPADEADQPVPTVFLLHGGPHAADEDRFSAARAVWLDAGFGVVHVNFRGSTGYGPAWRDAVEGSPGFTELEDVAATLDWSIHSGFADPEQCIVEGWSWGGYLALLALGTQPKRWAAGIAGVPVADYPTAYANEMEPLRAFDRALFGGSPEEQPDRYRECSPLTYVEAVEAPVLVLVGENDPRCPVRQVDNYLDALAAAGKDHAVLRYDAGHGSLVVAETMRHTAAEVDFARRVVHH